MDLVTFSQSVAQKFEKTQDLEARLVSAKKLATHYGFTRPELVLFLTHPENARLTIPERCQKLGITEEEYLLATSEEGFQRFIGEYQQTLTQTVRLQATASASQALMTDRYGYTRDGTQITDHKLEAEIIRSMAPQGNVQVNVQNNLWSDARKLAGR